MKNKFGEKDLGKRFKFISRTLTVYGLTELSLKILKNCFSKGSYREVPI